MELHTLGVDGGYTQRDVEQVAKAFTGWQVQNGQFFFNAVDHDTGVKTVLGQTLPAGRGIEDGDQVLDILARHPSTARFLCTKLSRLFVSDQPPAALSSAAPRPTSPATARSAPPSRRSCARPSSATRSTSAPR